MNGTAKKRSVREIRRAFGPEVIALLNDHHKAIETLAAGLNARATTQKRIFDQLAELRERTFVGRLRWLLTGR